MLAFFFIFAGVSKVVSGGFSYVTPTVGEPWPLPQSWVVQTGSFAVDPANFGFNIINNNCTILQKAIDRYTSLILAMGPQNSISHNKSPKATLLTLDIDLGAPCEEMPYLYMSEQYELKICTAQYPNLAQLITNSVWGAIRGLETFSQLLIQDFDTGEVTLNCGQILDFPRFAHRGVMLDTSRHFLPVSIIAENLDLMAMNKFNVLHWHIVDDQSFPYVSGVYPDLSLMGSWDASQVYSAQDIQGVIDYATDRGIRVVAEFDTPGHTHSWGKGQPGLLTECYSDGVPDGSTGPIDPSNEANFAFLEDIFTEITQRFPDHYVHLGGDEVDFSCWASNPNINDFMASLNITGDYGGLEQYYITRLLDIIHNLPTQNGYVVWQEVFDNGVDIADDTVVHVWKNENNPAGYYPEMDRVTAANYTALLSSCWYLNYISYGVDWYKYYECDPQGFDGSTEQNQLVLGGEVAMWGEYVDRTNIVPRLWPRAAAPAERLWSDKDQTQSPEVAEPRLEEHRCRLLRRGFAVEPFGPSYCEGAI